MNKIGNAKGKIAPPSVLNSPEPDFMSWLICQVNCFVLWDKERIDHVSHLEMQATGVATQSTGLVKPSQPHWSQRGRLCTDYFDK